MKIKDKIFIIGIIVTLIGSGIVVNYVSSTQKGEEFTEFYILGPGGKMDNYPAQLSVGEKAELILGVKNHEFETENYRVLMSLENEIIKSFEKIKLRHGEKWEEKINFNLQEPGEHMKLEFLLLRDKNDQPYRELHLWVTVESA